MRVISGKWKGRKLFAVPGRTTRPTADKVKEALFNMIGPYFTGGIGLDLFAGTGGLGIEALSRGFDRFIFIDRDIRAVETIRANLKQVGGWDEAEVFRSDADRALSQLKKRGFRFHLVFMDPPYAEEKNVHFLERFLEENLLEPGAIVVVERDREREIHFRDTRLPLWKESRFGDTALSIYLREKSP
ncbi:MAG: 16S rRNA (guanine(966)-N(2))-methyltransferase RsmD [Thermicanus sp.]|nr:16S rRNA (guanine(966)-N(2))-methyltransferase RsmD [Thermicanus sp.]